MSHDDWDERGVCPNCASTSRDVVDILFLFGPYSGWLLKCNVCLHEWKYRPPRSGSAGLKRDGIFQ